MMIGKNIASTLACLALLSYFMIQMTPLWLSYDMGAKGQICPMHALQNIDLSESEKNEKDAEQSYLASAFCPSCSSRAALFQHQNYIYAPAPRYKNLFFFSILREISLYQQYKIKTSFPRAPPFIS